MGSTTAGHHIERAAKTVATWKVILGGIVVALAWFAGQSGWLTMSPNDRVRALEAQSAAHESRISMNELEIRETRELQQFSVDLLCAPILDAPALSVGDKRLRDDCLAWTEGRQK